ncbi:hypothetical protein LPTSP4_32990 [Leptospira ryugenii]|uniref:Uncharacterized protein n=1 Tax=Leptospira ryugenii TaxID=1917863 RepID=A0A2P2E4F1_9LEPT|nr:hypothetical protein [Leptospira ryugenii]GBF51761.1 hypothetical protein LPTSP4_32990 [Leptospira ryugenii]
MSLCHPGDPQVSCGSCCGLFNVKLSVDGYKALLTERTNEFQTTVDLSIRHTIAAFRQSREQKESSLSKNDEMTYNCPYLGYIDKNQKKIGCMIHPIFTGDPKSQNFSFYGASICQAYDCKNKESIHSELIQTAILRNVKDSLEYSHLAADHSLFFAIDSWIQLKGFSISEGYLSFHVEIDTMIQSRKRVLHDKNLTSFEINYANFLKLDELESFFLSFLTKEEWDKLQNASASL